MSRIPSRDLKFIALMVLIVGVFLAIGLPAAAKSEKKDREAAAEVQNCAVQNKGSRVLWFPCRGYRMSERLGEYLDLHPGLSVETISENNWSGGSTVVVRPK